MHQCCPSLTSLMLACDFILLPSLYTYVMLARGYEDERMINLDRESYSMSNTIPPGDNIFFCHPKDYCGRFTSYIFRCIRLLLQERKGWQIVSQGLFQKVNHDGDRNVLCQKITRNEGDRWQTKLSENRIDGGMIQDKVLTKLIVVRQTTQEEKYWI